MIVDKTFSHFLSSCGKTRHYSIWELNIKKLRWFQTFSFRVITIRISLDTKFYLKLDVLVFWVNFFGPKQKSEPHYRIKHIQILLVSQIVHLRQKCFDFLDQVCKRKVFLVQRRINEHHYQTQNIWISLDTKFHSKTTILIFYTKFVKNEHFRTNAGQARQINITTKFSILELV